MDRRTRELEELEAEMQLQDQAATESVRKEVPDAPQKRRRLTGQLEEISLEPPAPLEPFDFRAIITTPRALLEEVGNVSKSVSERSIARLRKRPAAAMEPQDQANEADDEIPLERKKLRGKQTPPAHMAIQTAVEAEEQGYEGDSEAEPVQKKATRKLWPNELCPGSNGKVCNHSTRERGSQATTQRGQKYCMFCCEKQYDKIRAVNSGGLVTQALRWFEAWSDDELQERLEIIREWKGDAEVAFFEQRMSSRKSRSNTSVAARSTATTSHQDLWQTLLAKRVRIAAPLNDKQKEEFKNVVMRDQANVRRKFFVPEAKRRHITPAAEEEEKETMKKLGLVAADVLDNDTGLPAAAKDKNERAWFVEQWCKFGSWQMCDLCSSMVAVPLEPMDLKRVKPSTMKHCSNCKLVPEKRAYVPQPSHVPEALLHLKKKVVAALRPLDMDTGAFERARYGYRVHKAMISFAWAEKRVKDKIKELSKPKDRAAARRAYDHLMDCDDSMYKSFVERHADFLREHRNPNEKKRKRPLRFIEEKGLECALWPHLYWHENMCETVVRLTDERRERGKAEETDSGSSSDSESSDAEAAARKPRLTEGRHSVRHNFMTKVFSPVVGYSEEYELMQFVYDLVMWSCLGSAKNSAKKVPLRLALKGQSFTPAYWLVRHLGLIDMQRQCGYPALFRTRAPLERSFPYHVLIMDEMAKAGRGRQMLAGLETLHQAHVLTQLDCGFFAGMNKQNKSDKSRKWTEHLLGNANPDGPDTVLNHFCRLEFQDGKRKRGTQRYHGRGTVHSHSLDYLTNLADIELENLFAATIPTIESDARLAGIVKDSQLDYTKSGWPVRVDPSAWDPETNSLLLHHSAEDHAMHVRAYCPESMRITKCHEDVQQGDGRGKLLRYTATYTPKFSDSFAKDWMNDKASDWSVCRRVLTDYHPLEPEMWLTLAGSKFPQCSYGGSMDTLVAPWPGMEVKPVFVTRYEDCAWRKKDMTLLDYLRKSNKKGRIIRWVVEKHKQYIHSAVIKAIRMKEAQEDVASPKSDRGMREQLLNDFKARDDADKEVTLATYASQLHGLQLMELTCFANAVKPIGEKLISADTVSMLNDKFYGQWLMLHKPFRDMQDFLTKDIEERVPVRYRWFACALHHARTYWTDPQAIREDMMLGADGDDFIQTILAKVKAHTYHVERYLSGELKPDDVVDSDSDNDDQENRPTIKLNAKQKYLGKEIDKRMQLALKASEAEDDEEFEEATNEEVQQQMRPLAALGPPGTGKSAVIGEKVRKWHRKGARVLQTAPTANLASRMRADFPDIETDTCAGAFLFHRPLSEALAVMSQYDLIIIDEFSMLSKENFDRIMAMWSAAGRMVCLVLGGDFWQMPGPHKPPSKVSDSAAWETVKIIDFHEVFRCKDTVLGDKLAVLRTSMPSEELLTKKIADRKHRAWVTKNPTAWDVLQLMRNTNHKTTVVTCTRKAAALVMRMCFLVYFFAVCVPYFKKKNDWSTLLPCRFCFKIASNQAWVLYPWIGIPTWITSIRMATSSKDRHHRERVCKCMKA